MRADLFVDIVDLSRAISSALLRHAVSIERVETKPIERGAVVPNQHEFAWFLVYYTPS